MKIELLLVEQIVISRLASGAWKIDMLLDRHRITSHTRLFLSPLCPLVQDAHSVGGLLC